MKKKTQTTIENKSPLDTTDNEELEHLQSDVDDEEDRERDCSITSDLDDEDIDIQETCIEPLYVLPLFAILSSEKQARVRFISTNYFI